MKSKRKRIYFLFWFAFCVYLISLVVPYTVYEEYFEDTQTTEKVYSSGIEEVLPTFCLIPIVILIILIYVKHTNLTRWITLILSSLLIFPMLPLLYLTTVFSFFRQSDPSIGFYLNGIAFILFLIVAIIKFRIPAERNKQVSEVDILDDF
jgi:hypothetical protein